MFEILFYIVLIIIIAGLIMVGTNILYDLAAVLPFAAVLLIVVGLVVGLVEAVRNTFSAYKDVYGKGGKTK